jgi:hypothetical protein
MDAQCESVTQDQTAISSASAAEDRASRGDARHTATAHLLAACRLYLPEGLGSAQRHHLDS